MSLSGRWLPPFLVVLAGTWALMPVVLGGIPFNNDLANHYHFALPFYDAITGGDFYPGWLATSNQGYGDPLFRFYPPGLYYLMALSRSVTGEWYAASMLAFTFLSILGSLGAYFWASSFLPRHVAAWAGVFYAFMPYRMAEVYQAAQIAEFAAGVALLFALGFTKRICERETWSNVGGLAASYGLLILTHLPMAIFGSITLLIYALLCLRAERRLRTLVKLFCAALLGLAATAFYWITPLTEMKWLIGDNVHSDSLLDYRSNFIFSTFSPEKNNTIWWMNILTIVTLVMCLPALGLLFKRLRTTYRDVFSIAVLLVFTLLMTTVISLPVWMAIPPLRMTQHPFRWLAVTSNVSPLLMAASVPLWWKIFRSRNRYIALALAGLVLMSLTFVLAQIIRPARYLSRSEFDQLIQPLKESPSLVIWLPIWAKEVGKGKASYEKIPALRNSDLVEAGNRRINIISWQSLTRSFQLEPGESVEARVRTFYYPHWVASANGRPLQRRAGEDGALLVSLPADATIVKLEFLEPPYSSIWAVAGICSWALIAALILGSLKPTPLGRAMTTTLSATADLNHRSDSGRNGLSESEWLQQDHYNTISAEYETHYSDPWSIEYRRQFIYEPLFDGIDVKEKRILDAMCGSGQTTEYLLSRNATITGLDISSEAINCYSFRCRDCEATSRSILDSGFPDDAFDLVVVVGGLHHLHPDVSRAVSEIHRVLKPGGYFCFMEPHSGSLPNLIRRVWYKYDRFFSPNEAAIDLASLSREFSSHFEVKKVRYLGNVAFLLVLNSLIFRIPVRAKRFYSPWLIKLEQLLSLLQRKSTSCFAVVQWKKL